MMKPGKKSRQVPSECLVRSQGGLWVRGVITPECIEISWKPRFQYEGGTVSVLDFNGDIESVVHASEVEWGDEWRLAGEVKLIDEMAVMAGLENFDRFVFGLTRQIVHLIVCGYGETPEEVIGWASDFVNREFIVEGEYRVVDGHGDFEGLDGNRVLIEILENNLIVAKVFVREAEFEFNIDDESKFGSFVISTIPV